MRSASPGRAGLYALVFDLGAQAERVRATGRGMVLPLGLPAERINERVADMANYQIEHPPAELMIT